MKPLRAKTVDEALGILTTLNRRASKPLAKAIASAFANAKQQDPTLSPEQVVISRLAADGGTTWKRFRPAAFGRGVVIRKRTAHITVELDRRHLKPTAPPQPPPASARPARTRRAVAKATS